MDRICSFFSLLSNKQAKKYKNNVDRSVHILFLFLQTYTKEAVEHVQEALTQAQRVKTLDQNIFKVNSLLW